MTSSKDLRKELAELEAANAAAKSWGAAVGARHARIKELRAILSQPLIVTNDDIGRTVLYHSRQKDVRPEPGVITSYNTDYVFVRFFGDRNSKACCRIDLEYET